jgi:ATP-dependent Lon protease
MNKQKKESNSSLCITKNNKELTNQDEFHIFIVEKIKYIQDIIRNTIISVKTNKLLEIFSNNDANLSISVLSELYTKTNELLKNLITENRQKDYSVKHIDNLIEGLQQIIDKLSMIISGFGTMNIDDLLFISFGSEFKNMKIENKLMQHKYELIKKYIHPLGYKTIPWKTSRTSIKNDFQELCCNKITEDTIQFENSDMFECFDTDKTSKSFYQKINGIRVVIQNEKNKKTLIINGIVEDIHLECFNNGYIESRKNELQTMANRFANNEKEVIERIIDVMTLKDILIFGNEDIKKKMLALFTEINSIKNSKLDVVIKKFLELDVCSQRSMLIHLLIYNKDTDIQYICYILYDLITANSVNNPESKEQQYIYDSLPWKIKIYFKDVLNYTIKFTNEIMNKYDINKITLEQQIYLLKANESIKEKAILKLKELKGKPEEISGKIKQYLEGLVKIPFGVYIEEPILKKTKEINRWFKNLSLMISHFFPEMKIIKKDKYTTVEINNFIKQVSKHIDSNVLNILKEMCDKRTAKQIIYIVQYINTLKHKDKEKKLKIANETKKNHVDEIIKYVEINKKTKPQLLLTMYDKINVENNISLLKTITDIGTLKTNISQLENSIKEIENVLDDSIYSHRHAKNQILKIIGQWMNGEQTGYCFGFEGSPGIGKTSLAKKGLSRCLKNENGEPRPFSFIALGGSSHGSSIEGYSYTYLNSTWGKIVDILMDTKCMNPIIYVDELDKVSKTEDGREIISIFTHLIDSTQNTCFQDKYFSGIDIDLSKALFIFSYNDPEQIDKILLDRIHRVKFENLTLDDKMVIVKKYILPEINTKMGFENVVDIDDEMIEHIIESYTLEPGVRKLKELLFDLFGEINLDMLKYSNEDNVEIPIKITKENLENKYLIKYQKIQQKCIHLENEIGIINGLWANSLGRGGIIPIQTLFFPSSVFLELQLTGLQGDVMKESMNVAKSLAWNLTSNEVKKTWLIQFQETKCQGLHIHCPEGAISKDGPSAGAAITTAIYSLLNNKPIKNNIAITGEISLSGEITAIGGLVIKIMGGIKAGVTTFLYPKSNARDYLEWKKIYKHEDKLENINFYEVSTINDVFEHVFA